MPEPWTGRLIGRLHNEGFTRRDLAAEVGWTPTYVGMCLNGKRNPAGAREMLEEALERLIEKRGEP